MRSTSLDTYAGWHGASKFRARGCTVLLKGDHLLELTAPRSLGTVKGYFLFKSLSSENQCRGSLFHSRIVLLHPVTLLSFRDSDAVIYGLQ